MLNIEINQMLKKYFTARIDIKNFGSKNNNIQIVDYSDNNAQIDYPAWFKNEFGNGMVIESDNCSLDLKLKCINEGNLRILLRGIHCKDKHENLFPVYIDYTTFEINNESVINNNVLTWHDEPYVYEKSVKNREIINIHIEWLPFNNLSEYANPIVNVKKRLSFVEDQLREIPQLSCTAFGKSVLNGKIVYRNWLPIGSQRLMDDINGFCENQWFTRYLNHKFPNENFKINFFGPFGKHYNLKSEMDGKKVFYSQENLNKNKCYIEMKMDFDRYALDYVDLSMGFDIINNRKYLRFPIWLWYHSFPPEVTAEQIERTVELWNSLDYPKSSDVVNISSHDLWGTRTNIVKDIEKFTNITFGGKWRNNTRDLWDVYNNNKNLFMRPFKFNLCAENIVDDAYVTEKIFESIMADCIPLYSGGGNYLEPKVLNQKAILKWDIGKYSDNEDTIELFKNLISDEKTYNEFKDQDKLLNSSAKYIINKFTKLEKHFERLIYD